MLGDWFICEWRWEQGEQLQVFSVQLHTLRASGFRGMQSEQHAAGTGTR